jgi:crotonobetainyl-CoA:carnitine CoA-transferase CaiB-like acyl-CoA transferase
MLGDAGADVVKVEDPGGDPLRRWSCSGVDLGDGDGALFRHLHHGVRSVVAPVGSPERADLVAGADVVITNEPGAIDPDAGQIVVAITPFGLDHPWAGRAASELTMQADAGAVATRGHPRTAPIQSGGRVTEWVSGVYAAVSVLACCRRQAATGQGELIDISMVEVANGTATNFSDLSDSMRGRPDLSQAPPARTLETPSIEPTSDGYVGFNTNTAQMFSDFTVLIERPELLEEDPTWSGVATRFSRWDQWNEIVHAWTTRHTTADVVEQASLLRIPVAPVCSGKTVLELDHMQERGVFLDDPTGTFKHPRRPWTIDAEPAPPTSPAPRAGEHTGRIEPHTPTRPAPRTSEKRLPLDGVRVLDLTAWWAGPTSTGVLAALGAEVIHVESITRPDGIRMTGGAFSGAPQWWERSSFFLQSNTNKQGITLDLNTAVGRDLVLGLVGRSDLVVENFTPRVLENFKLGWDVIHDVNPRAVMVRMPAFGLSGPWRDRQGFAQTMEQVTGLAWVTGHADDQPRIQRGPCDPNAGMHAAFAAMIGLARRDRTGTGCLVEAPMVEAALQIACEQVIEWTAYGNLLERDGNRSPWGAPQNLYACRGREHWLALAVTSDEQWDGLKEVLGRPAWADADAFADHWSRRAHHDDLDGHLAAWAAEQDVEEAVDALQTAGVPAAVAIDPRRAFFHPGVNARGYLEPVDHPVIGTNPIAGWPFRFASVDRWIRTPAPTLGQHNADVLGGILGCSVDELAKLEDAKVIGDWPVGIDRPAKEGV